MNWHALQMSDKKDATVSHPPPKMGALLDYYGFYFLKVQISIMERQIDARRQFSRLGQPPTRWLLGVNG